MNPEVILAAAGTVGGLGGAYAAVMTYLENKGIHRSASRNENMANAIAGQLHPVTEAHSRLETTVSALTADCQRITDAVGRNTVAVAALSDRITVLETKMEVFWRNVGIEVAKVLHSPNPARAHVDALLEALMDGRITPAQSDELRGILQYIRDYHQGDKSDFPIYAGDQVAAAILLQTMGFVEPRKM